MFAIPSPRSRLDDDAFAPRPRLLDLAETDPQDELRFARRSARYLADVGVSRPDIRKALHRELDLDADQVDAAVATLPRAA